MAARAIAVEALRADLDGGHQQVSIRLAPRVFRGHLFGQVRQAGGVHGLRRGIAMSQRGLWHGETDEACKAGGQDWFGQH
ncbi:hypothetical protein ABFB10_00445 [Ponticoccus litoralis]|uniref:Uncharacterized protein n=1 Tax=Ponticoccus litoralis TaxID=422297 RepID=A0AAW9SIH8_9RHOB